MNSPDTSKVLVDVYSALLLRHNDRSSLQQYIADQDFRNYLFDIGFFQGVFVFYDLQAREKIYTLDELPWFDRRKGNSADVMDGPWREQINDVFKRHAQEEFKLVQSIIKERSDERGLIFVPSGEMSAFAFHDAIERQETKPSAEAVDRLAQKLGLVLVSGEPTPRYEDMYAWMANCLTPTADLDNYSDYRRVLTTTLTHLAGLEADTTPSAKLHFLKSNGQRGLRMLADAIWNLRRPDTGIQTIAAFNIPGHAFLRENEVIPRSLLIYTVMDGPTHYSIFFGTFENDKLTAEEALTTSFINSLGPLLLASIFMMRDVLVIDASVAFQASLPSWLRPLTSNQRQEFATSTQQAIQALENLYLFLGLNADKGAKPELEQARRKAIDASADVLERWIKRVKGASSLPWSIKLPSLNNQTIEDALAGLVASQSGLKDRDYTLLDTIRTTLRRYLTDAEEVVNTLQVATASDFVAVVSRGGRALEITQAGESVGSVPLSKTQLSFFERLVGQEQWFSASDMFDPTLSVKELAQFMHYLNKKVHQATGNRVDRLFVSKGYGTQQYRCIIPGIRMAD
jgi:hypothetical protein